MRGTAMLTQHHSITASHASAQRGARVRHHTRFIHTMHGPGAGSTFPCVPIRCQAPAHRRIEAWGDSPGRVRSWAGGAVSGESGRVRIAHPRFHPKPPSLAPSMSAPPAKQCCPMDRAQHAYAPPHTAAQTQPPHMAQLAARPSVVRCASSSH